MVGDELEIIEAEGLIFGELGAEWATITSSDGGLR
jgi:hypothetical protein